MTLVDTSVWIDAERKQPMASARTEELIRAGKAVVSAVTVFELTSGHRTDLGTLRDYERLFAGPVRVIAVTHLAARIAARLARDLRIPVGAPDALIAGTALELGVPVLTGDAGFKRFPGLQVEWIPRPAVIHEPAAEYAAPRPDPGAIASRIRELRRALAMPASQVAAAAGMARSNYARLEAGRHQPGLATLSRAAAALRVPLAELLRA